MSKMSRAVAQPPQPSRTWGAAAGAAGSPTAHGGACGIPAQDQASGEGAEALPSAQLPGHSQEQPSGLCRGASKSPPCAGHSPMVPPEGTGVSPHPSLSLCHLCFAVTDRQAPAHRTINYSRAPFLHIDVKSKFPACPSPAFQMRFSRHKDPSSCRAIEHATTSEVRRDPYCHQHIH